MTAAFANNTMVAFGDVNLADDPIGSPYEAGAGGWPTIRYFNQQTGPGGKAYTQKTDKPMCEELGDVINMRTYVTSAGSTSPCDLGTGEECTDQEVEYRAKFDGKTEAELSAQIDKLMQKGAGKMKPHLRDWLGQRLNVLHQLRAASRAAEPKQEL